MLHPRHPAHPLPARNRPSQENSHSSGIRQPAVPVRLHEQPVPSPSTQQPVIQGVFVFDGRVVINYPGDQPPPFWQQRYVKIYDAVYKDYVYVPIGQEQHYRATLAQVRADHPPEAPQDAATNDDDTIRQRLLDVYHHHATQPPPRPTQWGRGGRPIPPKPSLEAFLKAYDELKKTRNIREVPIEELYQEVLKKYNRFADTLEVGPYLLHESEVEERSQRFPEIRQVSQEEILKLSEGTEKVSDDRWGQAVASQKGIYTDEMAPCITVGLTATGPGGQTVSALFHSFQPEEKAKFMILSLQHAFPHFNQLSGVQYFVVGGSPESIDKAVDILKTLSAMHLDVSGVKLTTSIEERDLVKSVIVTPQGQVRYAVKKAAPREQQEPITFGGPEGTQGPGGFGHPGFGRPLGGSRPGPSTGFTTASNLNKEQGTPSFSGFSSASNLNREQSTPPFSGFSSASNLNREQSTPPFSGFTSASNLNREQSTPPFSGFTSASSLHKKEDKNKEKGLDD